MKINALIRATLVLGALLLSAVTFAQNNPMTVFNNTNCDIDITLEVRDGGVCGSGSICYKTKKITCPHDQYTEIHGFCDEPGAYWAKATIYFGGSTYNIDCGPNTSAGSPFCAASGANINFDWVGPNDIEVQL